MWVNPWIIKEICGNLIEILCVGGAIYWTMYAFAKVTYTINKNKNK